MKSEFAFFAKVGNFHNQENKKIKKQAQQMVKVRKIAFKPPLFPLLVEGGDFRGGQHLI